MAKFVVVISLAYEADTFDELFPKMVEIFDSVLLD